MTDKHFSIGIIAVTFLWFRTTSIPAVTFWLWWDRICIGFQWTSYTRVYFHSNKARKSNEVLDINGCIGRLHFNFTLWQIGRWERLVNLLPETF